MNIVRITTLLLLLNIRMYDWANNYSSMHIDSDNGLTQSNVKSITQDKYGFIWLGTKNGLNRYDGHQLLQFIVRDNEQHCSNQNVSALYSDRQGTLWVGTDEGLYYYDDAKNRFHRIITKAQDGTILNSWIANITEDNRGRIWAVAGDQGVYCYHSGTLKRYLYHFKKHEMPCNIIVCSDGSVWACSWSNGLFAYDENHDRFVNIREDADKRPLTGIQMNTIAQLNNKLIISVQNGHLMEYDMRKNTIGEVDGINPSGQIVRNAAVYGQEIWIGTHNGLFILNSSNKKVTHIKNDQNQAPTSQLSDDIIYHTFQDREGGVWVGTMFGGVSYLKKENKAFQHILSDDYGNRLHGYRIRDIIEHDGQIAVSTEDNGFSFIDLKTGRISNISSPYIPLTFFETSKGLGYSMFKNVVALFNNEQLAFGEILKKMGMGDHFSVFSIIKDYQGNIYAGTDIGLVRKNARSGKVEFVKKLDNCWIYDLCTDNQGNLWIATMGSGIWRLDIKSDQLVHYQHQAKNPNSLSSNSVSSITIDHTGNPWFSTDRGGICRYNRKSNDFTRYSKDKLLTATLERFEPTFAHNGKTLTISHTDENITANIDREAITKVLSNLFNNALKYSAHATSISMLKEDDKLRLTVLSDDTRIPQDNAEHIFEPFFRLNNAQEKRQMGSGIGLPLARSLAQLHKGQLYLDTTITEGNAFVLILPLNITPTQAEKAEKVKELAAAPDHPLEEKTTLTNENSRGRTILVVEDEEEIKEYMVERLQKSFIVEQAANGVEALEILQKEHVDLVVSDVMMPEMDGIELCHQIKSDIKLSHIPVVFLTAKNDTDSKIEGLKAGAEAYVEKPFSYEYLLTQIKSLLKNREKEREAFSKRPFFPIDNIQMSKEDEEMMQKVMNIINENINDEEFNVERLADLMYMSRSSLLRKIKQLFNMPPLEFIRLVRLKKAAELIQEGNHRVGEICYMVGFGNPSYFAKMFNRQFGVTPKEFEQQMTKLRRKANSQEG